MLRRPSRAFTDPQAFIAWENRQKRRYELIGTEIRLMAGGTQVHDLLAMNIGGLLRSAARASGCRVHGSNLKVVSPVGIVTYPDVLVRCGPLVREATECNDPVVVVEVLSPSTRAEDLVRKRWGYQAIPSLRHLLYVDASHLKVEVATRGEDGSWHSVFLEGPDAVIRLEALDVALPLADVYEGTGLP